MTRGWVAEMRRRQRAQDAHIRQLKRDIKQLNKRYAELRGGPRHRRE